jgi:hypothetical protein
MVVDICRAWFLRRLSGFSHFCDMGTGLKELFAMKESKMRVRWCWERQEWQDAGSLLCWQWSKDWQQWVAYYYHGAWVKPGDY